MFKKVDGFKNIRIREDGASDQSQKRCTAVYMQSCLY